MISTKPMYIRLPEAQIDRLDRLAASMDTTRASLIRETLNRFLPVIEHEAKQDARPVADIHQATA